MATSDAAICNMALSRVGVSKFIDSLDDPTVEAQTCKVLLPQVRDTLLAEFEWPFATRRAVLAPLAGVARTGWAYVYSLPADCVTAQNIWSGVRMPRPDQRIPFAIEDGASGTVLLCNEPDAELSYTARVTSPVLFPPLFADALQWALAGELGMSLAVKESVQQRAGQRYELALSKAKAAALNEGHEPTPESVLNTWRG